MFFKSKSNYDWLVVGLGNPGLQYESTRHNAGFRAVDLLAKEKGFQFSKNKFEAVLGEYKAGDKRILVIKPQTYMNNSGAAVTKVMQFYKIPLESIIVLHDDISLDVGKIRMRRKGSHGGQNQQYLFHIDLCGHYHHNHHSCRALVIESMPGCGQIFRGMDKY